MVTTTFVPDPTGLSGIVDIVMSSFVPCLFDNLTRHDALVPNDVVVPGHTAVLRVAVVAAAEHIDAAFAKTDSVIDECSTYRGSSLTHTSCRIRKHGEDTLNRAAQKRSTTSQLASDSEHRFGRAPLGRAGRLAQQTRHRQPMAVLHDDVPHVGQLRRATHRLAIQSAVGICGAPVRIVLAGLPVEIGAILVAAVLRAEAPL